MALPIGGFMPIPLAMMIPFMATQSMVMGDAFGRAFQYGKRKISAMSNEEFNATSLEQQASEMFKAYKIIIGENHLRDAIRESSELQKVIIQEMLLILPKFVASVGTDVPTIETTPPTTVGTTTDGKTVTGTTTSGGITTTHYSDGTTSTSGTTTTLTNTVASPDPIFPHISIYTKFEVNYGTELTGSYKRSETLPKWRNVLASIIQQAGEHQIHGHGKGSHETELLKLFSFIRDQLTTKLGTFFY